jgi:sulfur-carrier protein
MSIQVEFFGVPRQRSGVAIALLDSDPEPLTLECALAELGRRFPEFGTDCLADNRLKPEYLANMDGRRFVHDPRTPLRDGDCLLIMSADAGG